jgi:hypothetical protein
VDDNVAVKLLLLAPILTIVVPAQSLHDLVIPRPAPPGARIAIGFLGALDRWDNPHRSVRALTLRLRQQGWQADSLSHRNLRTAKKAVLLALDQNQNGRIDPAEAASARIVIYGQSMGGAAAVRLARHLRSQHVPVLLTIQVDSFGLGDDTIPDNVRSAANFYQNEILTVRGQRRIKAANPARTNIIGNFEYDYPLWKIALTPESWPRQVFGGGHARMEADPVVWSCVESLILETGDLHCN